MTFEHSRTNMPFFNGWVRPFYDQPISTKLDAISIEEYLFSFDDTTTSEYINLGHLKIAL